MSHAYSVLIAALATTLTILILGGLLVLVLLPLAVVFHAPG